MVFLFVSIRSHDWNGRPHQWPERRSHPLPGLQNLHQPKFLPALQGRRQWPHDHGKTTNPRSPQGHCGSGTQPVLQPAEQQNVSHKCEFEDLKWIFLFLLFFFQLSFFFNFPAYFSVFVSISIHVVIIIKFTVICVVYPHAGETSRL